jgi:hypothetical protein
VEREEREGRAGGSFGALHLQDWFFFLMAYVFVWGGEGVKGYFTDLERLRRARLCLIC